MNREIIRNHQMKLISNAVLLATIVNINLYAFSKDWENIDNLEKSGKM